MTPPAAFHDDLPEPFVWRCTKCRWTGPHERCAVDIIRHALHCPQCLRLGYYHDVERVPLSKLPAWEEP